MPDDIDDKKGIQEFIDLVERRTSKRLNDAEAHSLYLRLMRLYRVLIHKPPGQEEHQCSGNAPRESESR